MIAKKSTDIFIQIFGILLSLLFLFPLLYALSVSFMEHKDVLSMKPNLLPPTITWDNYSQVFTKTNLDRYMFNSLVMSAITSLTRILLGAMAAFAFAFFEFRGKRLLFGLTMATLMIPPDVLIIANYTTVSRLGLINTYIGLCAIYFVTASNIFLIRQHFLSFAKSLREAAYIDGCSNIKFFMTILLPVSKPILTTVLISSFVNVWNQYVWPMLVTNQDEMRTIQVGITMLKDRESSVFGPVMAGAVIALVPTVLVFIIFLRKIVSGMTAGAVKE